MSERTFSSTRSGGLDYSSFPMRLYQKAKEHGVWNPNDLDFSKDAEDWKSLDQGKQDHILQLLSLFQAGEEAVTLDLLPLVRLVAEEGRLEEELFLTTFLWEEGKHVDLFQTIFKKVMGGDVGDLSRYFYPGYETMFKEVLPTSLSRLERDRSVEAQVEASVTYNMVIEGVQAETGYWMFHRMLEENGIMPGIMNAVALLKRDESRHIAFGVYFLSRLMVEHGDEAWNAFEKRMAELAPLVEEQNQQLMGFFAESNPFGIKLEEVQEYTERQFGSRIARLQKARTQTLEELNRVGSVFAEEAA